MELKIRKWKQQLIYSKQFLSELEQLCFLHREPPTIWPLTACGGAMQIIDWAICLVLVFTLTFAEDAVSAQLPFPLTIATAQGVVKSGSDLTLKITLTNTSSRAISFSDTNRVCDYLVEVRDEKGNLAPDTPRKKQITCTGGSVEGRNIIVSLQPGESTEDEVVVTDLSDMTRPGFYSVQLARKAPKDLGGSLVKSNWLSIQVTP
jgi:hypothetical protein